MSTSPTLVLVPDPVILLKHVWQVKATTGFALNPFAFHQISLAISPNPLLKTVSAPWSRCRLHSPVRHQIWAAMIQNTSPQLRKEKSLSSKRSSILSIRFYFFLFRLYTVICTYRSIWGYCNWLCWSSHLITRFA